MASAHAIPSLDEEFEFTAESKRRLLIGIGAGVALVAIGAYLLASGAGSHGHHEVAHAAGVHEGAESGHHAYKWTNRLWANVWLNAVYFAGASVIGMFFISYNYLAQAGWSSAFKRVPEALPAFLPFTGIAILLVFFVAGHDLFHWTNPALYDKSSPEYDPIISGKHGFLNTPFYLIRIVLYFALWYVLWRMIRKYSLDEDLNGGTEYYDKSIRLGTAFLVVFGVTSSTSAWDFVMSIDTHWFSTMFGWYTLASWHVTGLAIITLTVVNLKERGYLKIVNESHLQDLGKFMFAFSIFWTYVWFAQFMLYYYANIPEETIYYRERFSGFGGIYKAPFFINILLNFVFPFLVLMTRDSKRTYIFLKIAAWGIIIGHYFDFYTNIMPGTVGEHGGFGPIEFGMILIFACGFMWSISSQLTKANLIPKNHPMLEEAIHHDI
ncbi:MULTISPECIES: quinol:cytochrome C oxidoreductase [Spirosoma]|uniref:Quinol:cytochrome C oxidoreductase n=1 Tax=Spirosoma liriopis TaxID=2937440 RepID=A0ABT0HIX7_9BACT|nr:MULTISPECIES: quinol:cytochrome C oxidoreductase [Spirosoma]MCK8492118.1 quinol:cytochrome C oxidoreductase [Spirosoma liriopis]UHG91539.1 quinol:cytochrome C oxidoreductase [Spirosoma oryzicola]